VLKLVISCATCNQRVIIFQRYPTLWNKFLLVFFLHASPSGDGFFIFSFYLILNKVMYSSYKGPRGFCFIQNLWMQKWKLHIVMNLQMMYVVSLNSSMQVATNFYSPNMNVGNENFLPLLKRLDECISWVLNHVIYVLCNNWTIFMIIDILIVILDMLKAIHNMQNQAFTCLNFVNSR